jgi:hypothetical protein
VIQNFPTSISEPLLTGIIFSQDTGVGDGDNDEACDADATPASCKNRRRGGVPTRRAPVRKPTVEERVAEAKRRIAPGSTS